MRVIPPELWKVPDTTPVRERLDRLTDLAMQGTSTAPVQRLAQKARTLASRMTFPNPRWGLASLALSVVQAAGYRPDPPGEWFQPVAYTADHSGDCEDLAALLMAVLYLLGFESRIVWIDQPGQPFNHVSGQIRLSDQWVWAEPSLEGAFLGEYPYTAMRRLDAFHKAAGASENRRIDIAA